MCNGRINVPILYWFEMLANLIFYSEKCFLSLLYKWFHIIKNGFWLGYDCCPIPLWIVLFDPGMSICVKKVSSGSEHNQNWPRSPCKAKIFEFQCNYRDSRGKSPIQPDTFLPRSTIPGLRYLVIWLVNLYLQCYNKMHPGSLRHWLSLIH